MHGTNVEKKKKKKGKKIQALFSDCNDPTLEGI
jgi:hypothetical protein